MSKHPLFQDVLNLSTRVLRQELQVFTGHTLERGLQHGLPGVIESDGAVLGLNKPATGQLSTGTGCQEPTGSHNGHVCRNLQGPGRQPQGNIALNQFLGHIGFHKAELAPDHTDPGVPGQNVLCQSTPGFLNPGLH